MVEQRYEVEGLDSREKELFNKLNDIGKGEDNYLFKQLMKWVSSCKYTTKSVCNCLDLDTELIIKRRMGNSL